MSREGVGTSLISEKMFLFVVVFLLFGGASFFEKII